QGFHVCDPAFTTQRAGRAAGVYGQVPCSSAAVLVGVGAEAIKHVVHYGAGGVVLGQHGEVLLGPLAYGLQVQRQLALDDDAQHTQGSPAQGERVTGAGRRLVDAEQAHQRVDTVSDGHGAAGQGGGQVVAG